MDQDIFRQLAIAAMDNAEALYNEATLLFEAGHYARSLYLIQIAGEELGKSIMCTSAYVNHARGKFDEKKFMRKFRAHRAKTMAVSAFEDDLLDIFNGREPTDKELLERLANAPDDVETLELVKLSSLYVDVLDGAHVSLPTKVITKEPAEQALQLLKNRRALFETLGTRRFLESRETSEAILKSTVEGIDKLEAELHLPHTSEE